VLAPQQKHLLCQEQDLSIGKISLSRAGTKSRLLPFLCIHQPASPFGLWSMGDFPQVLQMSVLFSHLFNSAPQQSFTFFNTLHLPLFLI
jgi:hypothetical protein